MHPFFRCDPTARNPFLHLDQATQTHLCLSIRSKYFTKQCFIFPRAVHMAEHVLFYFMPEEECRPRTPRFLPQLALAAAALHPRPDAQRAVPRRQLTTFSTVPRSACCHTCVSWPFSCHGSHLTPMPRPLLPAPAVVPIALPLSPGLERALCFALVHVPQVTVTQQRLPPRIPILLWLARTPLSTSARVFFGGLSLFRPPG